MTWAFIAQKPSSRFIAPIALQSVRILQVISRRLECLITQITAPGMFTNLSLVLLLLLAGSLVPKFHFQLSEKS